MKGSHGWCSEGAVARVRRLHWARCGDESALNGKMSEASLMSCTSGRRRGNFSAHSSSALSEIALNRSFCSGTAAAMSMDASASDDTSIEASTSCIHTPAVARAARPVETGANVDSCSAVASAGRRKKRSIFVAGRVAPEAAQATSDGRTQLPRANTADPATTSVRSK